MTSGRTVVTVPISAIKVLTSRERNQSRFKELVQSVAALGLKRPITLCKREKAEVYDLVCGERRVDAFTALGQFSIPALLVEAPIEDCILMGLIENFARRRHSPKELVAEIGRLAKEYQLSEIAAKLDLSVDRIRAIVFLLRHGEERLLSAVERGIVPPTLALEIAKTKSPKLQGALLEAHLSEGHTAQQIGKIRKLVEQRQRSIAKAGLPEKASIQLILFVLSASRPNASKCFAEKATSRMRD